MTRYFGFDDVLALSRWASPKGRNVFEDEFATYAGTKYAIGTSFGRTALYLGLKAIDIRDKEVIVPAFICTVVRHAVVRAGGIPRFVDIDTDDFTLDLNELSKNISEHTKALILVHYFGRVARNMRDVIETAKQNNLILIEDCAHSLGAEYTGKKVGTFGHFSIFSLTKSMINFGGGVLVTNDAEIYRNAQEFLKNEEIALRKKIADFPLIVAYGVEQAANKLIFDRIKKSIFKWWLGNVPRLLVGLRSVLIKAAKSAAVLTKGPQRTSDTSTDESELRACAGYPQGIHMEPIVASLGRTQLRKAAYLVARKKSVTEGLAQSPYYHFKDGGNPSFKDAYTHVVLRFPNSDIFQVIERCKKEGLLLRATWPTHQTLWENQDTPNVRKIEKEFLTWDVNPMVTDREIERFCKIIREVSKSTESS